MKEIIELLDRCDTLIMEEVFRREREFKEHSKQWQVSQEGVDYHENTAQMRVIGNETLHDLIDDLELIEKP